MRLVDVMCRHVVTVGPDDPLRTAAETILWTEHRHLPVVSNRDIVGVISEHWGVPAAFLAMGAAGLAGTLALLLAARRPRPPTETLSRV